ncbi:asparagine synthase-related protein [Desulfovibrio sp. Fe33]|uniref:asparagine synthase-related protein n=1 Tax=Desulfovibrio sp. Fe33 TaxID=3020842 RepID=UPI00234CE5D7|nr:asparagine synthetase B family protein [Desulfovibrio sp. Fe33]
MHFILGKAGTWTREELDKTRRVLTEEYGEECQFVETGQGFILCPAGEDKPLTGIFISNGLCVVFYGVAHHPVPHWAYMETPQDSPQLTAKHIASLYTEHGDRFLADITGSFACCIFDEAAQRALLFTDHAGMRNLYLAETPGEVWFSTNPRTLAKSLPQKPTVNRSFEDFFLCYGFHPFNGTSYTGVTGHKSDCLVEVHAGETRTFKAEKSALNVPDVAELPEDEATDMLYDVFMQSVEGQCTAGDKVGVLLGGVDSALVAAALRRLGKEVHTYSFYYDLNNFNQPHTDTLAESIGTTHHWVRITPEVIAEGLASYADVFCQETNWLNYPVQTAFLCAQIKEDGISHVYTGDGCDGAFLGYPNVHKRSVIYNSIANLPEGLLNTVLGLLSVAPVEYATGRIYTLFMNVLRSLKRRGAERLLLSFKVADEASLGRLRGGNAPVQNMAIEEIITSLSRPWSRNTPDRISYAGKSMLSPNKIKMNGCMDQHGLCLFSPYLHPVLKQFAQNLPDKYLRPKDNTGSNARLGKYILLKMIEKHELLPHEIIYQRKVAAVDAPIDDWYRDTLRAAIMQELKGLPFPANKRYVNFLLRNHPLTSFYKRHLSSDQLSTHTISLLLTYASFTKGF